MKVHSSRTKANWSGGGGGGGGGHMWGSCEGNRSLPRF